MRDKDAVNASLLICEMFAWYKSQGKSLMDVLEELYEQYAYFQSKLLSFAFEGSSGMVKMQGFMDGLRNAPPKEIAGIPVEKCVGYLDEGATRRRYVPRGRSRS